MDEIFHSNQTKALNNATEYDVKEILTMILGRCFVIQKKRKVTMFEYETTFVFKTDFDVQVYIHNPGNSTEWRSNNNN